MSEDWVETTLAGLSLEEKVGQLVMTSCFDTSESGIAAYRKKLDEFPMGGVFIFHGSQEHISGCTTQLQRDRKVPLLMGCDYENGAGYIIADGTRFPRQMARGWLADEEMEYLIGKITAEEGRALGMHITMSPVLDVGDDWRCPDLNIRAWSDEASVVRKLAVPYIKGLQENGLLAGAKHFPGYGGSGMDQHISASLLLDSREEIEAKRLAPYRDAIARADLAALMVGHLEVPALTSERHPLTGRAVPTTLSREVLQDLLREQLGFTGLIVSDAMDMGGVTNQYTRAEAAIKAISAGVDMLLVFSGGSWEFEYEALLSAARGGELAEERVEQAARQVLRAKKRADLDAAPLASSESQRAELFAAGRNDTLREELSGRAVTVLWNRDEILPLGDVRGRRLLMLDCYGPERSSMQLQGQHVPEVRLREMLEERGAEVEHFIIESGLTRDDEARIRQALERCECVLYNFICIPSWGVGTSIPNRGAVGLFYRGLFSWGKPVVVTALGDPYVAYYCPSAPAYVATFDEGPASQEAAVQVWCGETGATGRMPVTLPGIFARGDGLDVG